MKKTQNNIITSIIQSRKYASRVLSLALLCVWIPFCLSPSAQAISDDQRKLLRSGVKYFNVDEEGCSPTATPTSSAGISSGNLYILGDSITVRAQSKYRADFSAKGVTPIINASVGRSWTGGGQTGTGNTTAEGSNKPGRDAVNDDAAKIQSAKGIVVALGSNGGEAANPVSEIISTIRSKNPNAPIWWVNTAGTTGWTAVNLNYLGPFNKSVADGATTLNYHVIDWFKVVSPSGDPFVTPTTDPGSLLADGLHPNEAGIAKLSQLAVTSVTTTTTAPGTSAAGTLSLPAGTTEDQKIAQTFIVGFTGPQAEIAKQMVQKYHLGGVFILGSSNAPYTKPYFDGLNQAAGVPLIVASDEEGGKVQRFASGAVGIKPSAKELGQLPSDQVEAVGKDIGQKLLSVGVNTNLAPVLDVDNSISAAIHELDRAFSSDPNVVADKAGAFAKGLRSAGVNPVYKHFPGLGTTGGNTDLSAQTSPSLDSLKALDLKPYETLANQHQGMVMMDNARVPGLTGNEVASVNAAAVTLLRTNYSFSGIITTDDLKAGGVGMALPDAITKSLQSGVTMPLFTFTSDADIQAAINKVKASGFKVDDAIGRIMAYKSSTTQTTPEVPSGCACAPGQASSPALVGNDNFEKAYRYFIGKGLSPEQAAGVVGNMKVESGVDPENIQDPAGRSQNPDDAGSAGWGIIQWTPGGKVVGIAEQAAAAGVEYSNASGNIWELATQLDIVWWHMKNTSPTGVKNFLADYKNITAVDEAAIDFEDRMEGAGVTAHPARVSAAQDILKLYGGAAGSSSGGGSPGAGCNGGNGEDTQYVDGFRIYSQYDPDWKDLPYSTSTIGASGCGPSAMAMIITALKGTEVTPADTSTYAASIGMYIEGTGSSWDIGPKLAEHWGLKSEFVGKDLAKITAALQAGKLIITPGKGATPFTSGGHFIVIRGITSEGKFKVGDSGHSDTSEQEWDAQTIINNMRDGGNYAISK